MTADKTYQRDFDGITTKYDDGTILRRRMTATFRLNKNVDSNDLNAARRI